MEEREYNNEREVVVRELSLLIDATSRMEDELNVVGSE